MTALPAVSAKALLNLCKKKRTLYEIKRTSIKNSPTFTGQNLDFYPARAGDLSGPAEH